MQLTTELSATYQTNITQRMLPNLQKSHATEKFLSLLNRLKRTLFVVNLFIIMRRFSSHKHYYTVLDAHNSH